MKHIKLFENNNDRYFVYTIQNFKDDSVIIKLFDSEESCIKYSINFIHNYDREYNDNYDCKDIIDYEELLDYWNTNYNMESISFEYEEFDVEHFELPERLKLLQQANKFNI